MQCLIFIFKLQKTRNRNNFFNFKKTIYVKPIISIVNDAFFPVKTERRWDCHYCNTGGPGQCTKRRKLNKQYRDGKGKGKPVVTCNDIITFVENVTRNNMETIRTNKIVRDFAGYKKNLILIALLYTGNNQLEIIQNKTSFVIVTKSRKYSEHKIIKTALYIYVKLGKNFSNLWKNLKLLKDIKIQYKLRDKLFGRANAIL